MIHQFDVFASPFRKGREERPYIVILQSDRIDTASRVCGFLIAERFLRPEGRLNPAFVVESRRCYFHPIELVTLPAQALREPIANLEAERDRIVAALDLVFTGI